MGRMHHTKMNEHEKYIEFVYLAKDYFAKSLLLSEDPQVKNFALFMIELGSEIHDELVTVYAEKRAEYGLQNQQGQ